jgi:hypothetical protein
MAPPAVTKKFVRKAPFAERVQAWLNPHDLYLWLYEELSSRDWEDFDKRWSNSLGLALNLTFIFIRINATSSSGGDDVFEDYPQKSKGVFATFVRKIQSSRAIGTNFIYL